VIVLGAAGDGDDPNEALRAFERTARIDLSSRAEHFTIGDLPAVRASADARSSEGPVALELTWIAVGGGIYRLLGATAPTKRATYGGAFRDTTMSFRRLTAAERAGFRETRLRLVTSRDGETIAQLLTRVGTTAWSPEMAAVANELRQGAALRGGEVLKVPVAEPYRRGSRRQNS
jgi:predicted Zn-dependent protease